MSVSVGLYGVTRRSPLGCGHRRKATQSRAVCLMPFVTNTLSRATAYQCLSHTNRSQMFCGAVAGLSQSIVTSPMELVKTRVQLQTESCVSTRSLSCAATSSSTVTNCSSYTSPVDCIKKIVTTEGWRGLFRGQFITVLRDVSPSLPGSTSPYTHLSFLFTFDLLYFLTFA